MIFLIAFHFYLQGLCYKFPHDKKALRSIKEKTHYRHW